MPIKLIPPRKGRSPYYYGRGSYLGVFVERSTKAVRASVARQAIAKWEQEIERGEFDAGPEVTFLSAAVAYMQAGGDKRPVKKLLVHFGEKPLKEIGQAELDAAAVALFPTQAAATRNREVYTPVSAILKHSGFDKKIRRPKGWRGSRSTRWLEPEQAFTIFRAAEGLDLEFSILLKVYCYTGRRLSEILDTVIADVSLERQAIYLPDTKNGEPAPVYLPLVVVTALANHPRGLDRLATEKLFRWRKGGRLYKLWKEVKRAAGISFPPRQGGFHLFCHTYGTWLHRLGLDAWDMTETSRWKDPASAKRYAHTEPGAMARKADLFPVEKRKAR